MKKISIFSVIFLFIVSLCSAAFALSHAEYRSLMKNHAFANADKALNEAWTEAKYFTNNQSLSKVEAYTRVTNARANYIRNQTLELFQAYTMF